MNFKEYLKTQKRYSENTLNEKEKQLQNWQQYCGTNQSFETITTTELLKIVELQKRKYQPQTLNNQLLTIEQYFFYLIDKGIRKEHPLKNFRIKTEKKPLIKGLLTEEELNTIYENYPTKGHYGGQFDVYKQRNKVILGLMVYQGLSSGSIAQIELKDLHLKKGSIYIAERLKTRLNPRNLPLEAVQIIELNTYLTQTRNQLLVLIKTDSGATKLIPLGNKTKFSSITKNIKKQTELQDIQQLRNSRIALWLKQHNVRVVQYKSGYRRLLSLEQFKQDELESLKQAVAKYHPF
jgi:site-specific recombinase XerD